MVVAVVAVVAAAVAAAAAVGQTSAGRPAAASRDGAGSGAGAGRSAPGGPATARFAPGLPADRALARQLRGLTARQLAGQRVIYSYTGLWPPARLLSSIRRGEAAGVMFFSGNVGSRGHLAAVIRELRRAAAASPVRLPLLLMTDQEGGLLRRVPGPPLASERDIGSAADPGAAAARAGASAARNLRSIGLNVNLAPVLDVYRAPGNFIGQYGRSYSSSPGKVARLGADFIRAQQRGGVAATAKHFPGLGAAARWQNTDQVPVRLNLPLATIRAVDERPYRQAIAAGVRLVMVSWAVYPALDPHRPAGLSPAVVRGELRGRLGFRGVTITDAIGAGALRAFGPIPRRAVLAARAGMDLMLCTATGQAVSQGSECLDGLASGYRTGVLGRAAFDAAAERVLALRASLATRG
jgi:beta-N-acetylhexosaminidase